METKTENAAGPSAPASGSPFVQGVIRVRMDAAAGSMDDLRAVVVRILNMVEKSPEAPGWAYGGAIGNGVAYPADTPAEVSLREMVRIVEAVRLSTGLGKNQLERLARAKALLANTQASESGPKT